MTDLWPIVHHYLAVLFLAVYAFAILFGLTFDFTEDAMKELRRLDREGELEIIPITVRELLDKSGFEVAHV